MMQTFSLLLDSIPWSHKRGIHRKPVDTWHRLRGTCHLHHPDDGGGRRSEMSVRICQTARCHKTNSNKLHIYTLSKLRFIQSIMVMHCAQRWDMSTWEFRIWSACKNVVTANSNYCSWPAWPWIQRHYNPPNYLPNNTASQFCRLQYILYKILAGWEY